MVNIWLWVMCVSLTVVNGNDCSVSGGVCQDDRTSCDGEYHTGLCPGGTHNRCCIPSGADHCSPGGGVCQDDRTSCNGNYHTGLCPGGTHNRCCMPSSSSTSGCSGLTLVTRAEWGARAPKSISHLHNPVSQVFVHHTETPSCDSQSTCASRMRGIQNFHMDSRGWSDIGYSFLVGEDGRVYEGRGWDRVGAHTQGYNSVALAISFMGSYMSHNPGTAALSAANAWLSCAVSKGMITSTYKLYGHRDAGDTNCPGDSLYALIRTWSHYDHVGRPHH